MDTLLHPNLFTGLLFVWGAVTVVLVVHMIYKSILENREDDQIFLDKAESHLAREQAELVARLMVLDKRIMILGIASGSLLLLSGVVWVWIGLATNF